MKIVLVRKSVPRSKSSKPRSEAYATIQAYWKVFKKTYRQKAQLDIKKLWWNDINSEMCKLCIEKKQWNTNKKKDSGAQKMTRKAFFKARSQLDGNRFENISWREYQRWEMFKTIKRTVTTNQDITGEQRKRNDGVLPISNEDQN